MTDIFKTPECSCHTSSCCHLSSAISGSLSEGSALLVMKHYLHSAQTNAVNRQCQGPVDAEKSESAATGLRNTHAWKLLRASQWVCSAPQWLRITACGSTFKQNTLALMKLIRWPGQWQNNILSLYFWMIGRITWLSPRGNSFHYFCTFLRASTGLGARTHENTQP